MAKIKQLFEPKPFYFADKRVKIKNRIAVACITIGVALVYVGLGVWL